MIIPVGILVRILVKSVGIQTALTTNDKQSLVRLFFLISVVIPVEFMMNISHQRLQQHNAVIWVECNEEKRIEFTKNSSQISLKTPVGVLFFGSNYVGIRTIFQELLVRDQVEFLSEFTVVIRTKFL